LYYCVAHTTHFTEYRGHEICDPEDAKEIAQASANMQDFAYSEYAQAYDNLCAVAAQIEAAISRERMVRTQVKMLGKKVGGTLLLGL
jgi:hypothetical protein